MTHAFLLQAAVFLAAAAIAAPLAKRLRISSVLGYLIAGIAIGPFGIGLVYSVYEVENILKFAELGVVLLLFLIGLELKPKRLLAMRSAVFGGGGLQVVVTTAVLSIVVAALGFAVASAVFVAFALAMSSTAFVLQVLEEKGELKQRHGRLAFAVLLFQDLATIPMLALVPLFAASSALGQQMSWIGAAKALGIIFFVVLIGRFVLGHVYRLVASTGVREAMTASALLTVVGVALLMELAGLSAALGAFIAGALLAESPYRHQVEADVFPFEGLLLGLFFTAIGMSLNLALASARPLALLSAVAGLIVVKAAVLYGVGRWQGLAPAQARRLALAMSQGGEFAFVLFTAAVAAGVLSQSTTEFLSVVVTFSIMATPLLLLADDLLLRARARTVPAYETPPSSDGHVVIAGFGRVGQIVARVLSAKRIPFTALDSSAEQVDFVQRFGNKIYYGDASRLDILTAAETGAARAFVLAIDNVEASLRTAEIVRQHFPSVPVYARARNRQHAMRLMDLGAHTIHRETFLSSLAMTRDLLAGLGLSPRDVRFAIDTFKTHDERRLFEDYRLASDDQKLIARALTQTAELERLFIEDEQERNAEREAAA